MQVTPAPSEPVIPESIRQAAAAIGQPHQPPMPTPEAKRVRVTIWISPDTHKSMLHEGVDRRMSLGDIVEEAMRARVIPIWKMRKP